MPDEPTIGAPSAIGAQSIGATSIGADWSHRPAAYWFWHTIPTREQIRDQLSDLASGGYGSFQIQPRLAFPRDQFLGPAYLDAYAYAIRTAAERGLVAGIYDDYNWQSGHAAGRTVTGRDDLRETQTLWVTGSGPRLRISGVRSSTVGLGPAAMDWQYEGGVSAWGDWQIVAAVAHGDSTPAGGPGIAGFRDIAGTSDIAGFRDITDQATIVASGDDWCEIELTDDHPATEPATGPASAPTTAPTTAPTAAPTTKPTTAPAASTFVTVFVSARGLTSRLPNYLLPEAARRFTEVAYAPYAAALGDHLGSTVRYLFFDQPHPTFLDWDQRSGELGSNFLMAPVLAERLAHAWGPRWRVNLTALVHDVGDETPGLRRDFYETFGELAREAWLGTLRDWCHEHGIALTGHEVLGHVGSWNPRGAFDGWDLRVNFGADPFATDGYRDLTAADAQDCVPQLSAKLADSVARSNHRSGAIIEHYELGRWPAAYPGNWDLTLTELRAQAIRLHLQGMRQFLMHAFYSSDGRPIPPRTTDPASEWFVNPRFDFAPGINLEPWWVCHAAFADESTALSEFLDGAEPVCDVAVLWPTATHHAAGTSHPWADHVAAWAESLTRAGIGFRFVDEASLDLAGFRHLVLPAAEVLARPQTLDAVAAFVADSGRVTSSGPTPATSRRTGDLADRWRTFDGSVTAIDRLPQPGDVAAIALSLDHVRVETGADHDEPRPSIWQWVGRTDTTTRVAVFNDAAEAAELILVRPGQEPHRFTAEPMQLLCFDADRPPPHRIHEPADSPTIPLTDGWALLTERTASPEQTGPTPIRVDIGWERQGLPSFSGRGTYAISIPPPGPGSWSLELPEVHTAAAVRINGAPIGQCGWPPYRFTIDDRHWRDGANQIEVDVWNSAGNGYLPERDSAPAPSGLTAAPRLVRRG